MEKKRRTAYPLSMTDAVVVVVNLISIERWQREEKTTLFVTLSHRQIPNDEPSNEIERVITIVYVRLSHPNGR